VRGKKIPVKVHVREKEVVSEETGGGRVIV